MKFTTSSANNNNNTSSTSAPVEAQRKNNRSNGHQLNKADSAETNNSNNNGNNNALLTASSGGRRDGSQKQHHHHRHRPRYVTMLQLLEEMRDQNLDAIRFAVYRTACKLRFIQKRSNLILVDLWNVIEAFRDFHLTQMDGDTLVTLQQLGGLLTGMFSDLNKRLPQQVCVEYSASTVMSWLAATFDKDGTGTIPLLALKISLAVMSRAKLTDKLKYIFSLICSLQDPSAVWQPMTASSPDVSRKPNTAGTTVVNSGTLPSSSSHRRRLLPHRFDQCARIFARLSAALTPQNGTMVPAGQQSSISYTMMTHEKNNNNNNNSTSAGELDDTTLPTTPGILAKQVFGDPPGSDGHGATANEFVQRLQSQAAPGPFLWLPVMHRIAAAEHTIHPVRCAGCGRESFSGLRYHCQDCPPSAGGGEGVNFCQECFWRGRSQTAPHATGPLGNSRNGLHNSQHRLIEHTNYVSPARNFGESLRRSLACVPGRSSAVACGGMPGSSGSPSFYDNGNELGELFEPVAAPSHLEAEIRHIVPATPRMAHPPPPASATPKMYRHQFQPSNQQQTQQTMKPVGTNNTVGSADDEHNLIARYAARLAVEENDFQEEAGDNLINQLSSSMMHHHVPVTGGISSDIAERGSTTKSSDSESSLINTLASRMAGAGANGLFIGPDGTIMDDSEAIERRRLLEQLEARNREMAREIRRLRHERDAAVDAANAAVAKSANDSRIEPNFGNSQMMVGPNGTVLAAELESLRQHKDGLESRMTALQESRRDLMRQLEMLMAALKTGNTNVQLPIAASRIQQSSAYDSNYLTQPNLNASGLTPVMTPDGTGQPPSVWALRNDLLTAADSVTSAMSNLVKHFSSDTSETSEDDEYLQQWATRRGFTTSAINASRSRASQPLTGTTSLPNTTIPPSGGTSAYYATGATPPGVGASQASYYRQGAYPNTMPLSYANSSGQTQTPLQQQQTLSSTARTPFFYDPTAVTIHDI